MKELLEELGARVRDKVRRVVGYYDLAAQVDGVFADVARCIEAMQARAPVEMREAQVLVSGTMLVPSEAEWNRAARRFLAPHSSGENEQQPEREYERRPFAWSSQLYRVAPGESFTVQLDQAQCLLVDLTCVVLGAARMVDAIVGSNTVTPWAMGESVLTVVPRREPGVRLGFHLRALP